jgi:large subunit ribosomal protein L25
VSVRFELTAEPRSGAGKAVSRRLRRAGKVPAIIYGGGLSPSAIVLNQATLLHQMQREAFYTSILKVKQGAESVDVVVKDVHRHPFKPEILHLDFQRIVADQEITLSVPIHFVGEAAAKGVKDQGGMLEHLISDVEVSCLPRNLPEFLEIDVSQLALNEVLHLSDIRLPEGVELVPLRHGHNHPLVAIVPPRREEEEVVAVPGAEATEAAAPAAGTEAPAAKS